MPDFKVGGRVQWIDSPHAQGIVNSVCEGGIFIDWDQDVSETYFYSLKYLKDIEIAEAFQKPVDLPKYVIVEAKKNQFLEQVNELITKGYEPLQAPIALPDGLFMQALYRKP